MKVLFNQMLGWFMVALPVVIFMLFIGFRAGWETLGWCIIVVGLYLILNVGASLLENGNGE